MASQFLRWLRMSVKWAVPVSWRPGPYLHAKVHRVTRDVVYSGPFRGMKYLSQAFCSALLPKVLGTYELELHPVIEAACELNVDRIIDIGAAEGYYAVGFATRCPGRQVIAFELDVQARNLAEELIRMNGVSGTVTLMGKCEAHDLAALTLQGTSLVVSDCEGYESELLNMDRVPGLMRSYILVETHDFIVAGVTDLLLDRFAATHDIVRITQLNRRREDFPISDWYIRRMQELDLQGAMSEGRPVTMDWLWMIPKCGL